MKKLLALLLTLTALLMLCAMPGMAEDKLTQTTLLRDEDGLTGYEVAFRYINAETNRVRLFVQANFSDEVSATPFDQGQFSPFEWTPDMFPLSIGGRDGNWYVADMTKDADNVWSINLPLPNGWFQYYFYVGGSNEAELKDYTDAVRVSDPANPPEERYPGQQRYSNIYVPFDAEKQTQDFSYMAPRTDEKKGTIEYVSYTDENGDEAWLCVYLPYGYDKDRAEPYKLIVLQHGGGGCETDWINLGAANEILDNAIANGETEPCVAVSWAFKSGTGIKWWSVGMNRWTDAVKAVVEERYNVSKDMKDRAIMGDSAGGFYTCNMLALHPEEFEYYGIFAAGANNFGENYDYDKDEIRARKIMICSGLHDPVSIETTYPTMKLFKDLNIPFKKVMYQGNHQWHPWRQGLYYFLTQFIWK